MAEPPPIPPSTTAAAERDVLATKLHVPRTRPGVAARPRLVNRLAGTQGGELTLVCAPAGFGKTTLLADWARAGQRPVAWLSLDEGDNDPARFWRHAAAALDRMHPGVAEPVAALLGQPPPGSFEGPVTALVNRLAGVTEEAALVVDDYHWLGIWTTLAAATGARNGELCGLEWCDLDLDAGTVRFRQALTIVDPAVLLDGTGTGGGEAAGGRRKELAVGPVKSAASSAILTLPPFAVQALRQHHRQQARLRLALGQPATVPLRWVEPGRPPRLVELDLVFRTERGTPVNPNHASRTFAGLAASVGLAAPPPHAAPRPMATTKEPASLIAAQLSYAEGSGRASRHGGRIQHPAVRRPGAAGCGVPRAFDQRRLPGQACRGGAVPGCDGAAVRRQRTSGQDR
jgi:hypothetical protein